MEVDSLDFSQLRATALAFDVPFVPRKGRKAELRTVGLLELTATNDGPWLGDMMDTRGSNDNSSASAKNFPLASKEEGKGDGPRVSVSQPENRAKMNSDGTQKSGCTEPLSQWVYESPHFNKANQATIPGVPIDRSPQSYRPGEEGYIAFESRLAEFMQDHDKHSDELNTQDAEEPMAVSPLAEPVSQIDLLSQVDVRTELFPESHRFQQPKTPATSTKKRDSYGNIIDHTFATPRLPANPFGNRKSHDVGDIGLSQVFRATQGPSSSIANGFSSDPVSERPSPALNNLQRPSTALPSSSVKLERSSIRRSLTQPYTNWRPAHRSISQSPQAYMNRKKPYQSPVEGRPAIEDTSDPEFDSLANNMRRRMKKEQIERKARDQLNKITAKARPGSKLSMHSSPVPRQRVDHVLVVSDDSDEEDSEAETEHEEAPELLNVQEKDQLVEENKENMPSHNIQVPMTTTRPRGNSLSRATGQRSSPIVQRLSKAKIDKTPIDGVTGNLKPDHTPRFFQEDQIAEPDTLAVTIADSQLSQKSKEGNAMDPVEQVLPISSDGSKRIIRESQSYKDSAMSPLSSSPRVTKRSKPMGLMEIADNHVVNEDNEDVDLEINLMTEDDVLFKEKMDEYSEPSSPIDPRGKRKRRIARRSQALLNSRLIGTPAPNSFSSSPLRTLAQTDDITHHTKSAQISEEPVAQEAASKGNLIPRREPSQKLPSLEGDERSSGFNGGAAPSLVTSESEAWGARDASSYPKISSSPLEPEVRNSNKQAGQVAQRIPFSSDITTDAPVIRNNVETVNDLQRGHEIDHRESSPVVNPTRVLAYFPGSESGYYPATCRSSDIYGYVVVYDDGNIRNLAPRKVKRLELRKGDEVRIYQDGYRKNIYLVQSLERNHATQEAGFPTGDIFGNTHVVVKLKQAKKWGEVAATEDIFPIDRVYLTITMWPSLKKREYIHPSSDNIDTTGCNTPSLTSASPNKFVPRSSWTAKRETPIGPLTTGLFGHMIFVMTAIKDFRVRLAVQSHLNLGGGTVLDGGFEELFALPYETAPSPSSSIPSTSAATRSIMPSSPPSLETGQRSESAAGDRFAIPNGPWQSLCTFLIADSYSRNTKYFQALALGIPCVHTRWVQDCAAQRSLLNWRPYLLAAGESAYLDGAVVSRSFPGEGLDGSADWSLKAILERRNKWLDGKRVLLVSATTSGVDKVKAYDFIAQALGAKEVGIAKSKEEAQRMLHLRKDTGAAGTGEGGRCAWDWVCVDEEGRADWEGAQAWGEKRKTRPAKRRKGGKKDDEPASGESLAKGLRGVREVGTEFVVQSLILGKLIC